jgi:hypothetical protein
MKNHFTLSRLYRFEVSRPQGGGLPGNEISFFIVPLVPSYLPAVASKAGLTGHLPAKK